MKIGRFLFWLAIACVLSGGASAEKYSSPGLGSFVLEVPGEWRVQSQPGPVSVYLRIRPQDGDDFNLQVTSNWRLQEAIAGMTPEVLRERVQAIAKTFLPGALEPEAPLVELKGPGGAGYHFSLTARSDASALKYLTWGMLRTSVGVTTFTLLRRQPDIPEMERTLAMLAAAGYTREAGDRNGPTHSDAAQLVTQERTYQVWVPTSRVYLSIPRTRQLTPVSERVGGATKHPRYFHFTDRSFNVSGWLEPASKFSGMEKFWESETAAWRQAGHPAPSNVAFKTIGPWDAAIYDVPSPIGNSVHIRAHALQEGTWIDIHASYTLDRPSDEIRNGLETYLKGVFVLKRED